MKHRFPSAWLAGGLLLAAPARAQSAFTFGPRAGLLSSTVRFADGSGVATCSRPGFEAGLAGNLSAGHWALQPAVLYAQTGYRESGGLITIDLPATYAKDVCLRSVALPVNVAYALRADGQGPQVFAGAHAAWLVGGHYTERDTRYGRSGSAVEYEQDGPVVAGGNAAAYGALHVQRLDIGGQAGLGYRRRGLLVQAGYRLGLRNLGVNEVINNYAYPTPAQHSRAVYLSVAYLVGSKG